MASSLWSFARIPFYLGASVVTLASGSLYYFQNEIIYPRNLPAGARTDVPQPPQFGMDDTYRWEELALPTPDGETLAGFLVRPPNASQARPVTILTFHGNAGNAGHRLPIAKVLARDLRCTTVMLEYRGYGRSTGAPSEKGLAIDAQTGLDWIRAHDELAGQQIMIYGQSLGGAVAIDLVAKNAGTGDIKGLILENTFLSIPKMIPHAVPPARFLTGLCHERWQSEEAITRIRNLPVLFLSGLKDEIVPPSHMKQLLQLCKSTPVVWRELPDGDHNNSVGEPGYFQYIDDFIAEHVTREQGTTRKGTKRS